MANIQLNDPDFDQSVSASAERRTKSFFEQLSSKSALIVGLIGGLMTLCTIGFIILLILYINGGKLSGVTGSATDGIPVVQAPRPTPPAAQPNQPAAETPTGVAPPITKADHIRGDIRAPLIWIEYSDFECPFCKRFHPTMLRMLEEYAGKIKFVYRHFPLSFHQNAQKEAEASECANELGGTKAFWKYTDLIFERTTANGTGFALDALVPLAKEIGLNETKFKNCLDSGKYAAHVQQDEAGGQGAGVNGTPGSFLIGKDGKAQLLSGALPYEQVKAAIEAQLR